MGAVDAWHCTGLGADLQGVGHALSQGLSRWQSRNRSRKAGEDEAPSQLPQGLAHSTGSSASPFGLCLVRGFHLQVGCFRLGHTCTEAETPLSQLVVLKAHIRVALLND